MEPIKLDQQAEIPIAATTPIQQPYLDKTTPHLDHPLTDGCDELAQAREKASHLAAELGQPIDADWLIETSYLKQLKQSHPTRAREAIRWRPRFLTALTLTVSQLAACRAAGIAWNTYKNHERNDPDFARQAADALEQGAEILHLACWKSAIEGNLEPVYWQGILVGHVKKYDSRLRVELLRVHLPEKFKRSSAKMDVSINQEKNRQFIITREAADELAARWKASRERAQLRKAQTSSSSSSHEEPREGYG